MRYLPFLISSMLLAFAAIAQDADTGAVDEEQAAEADVVEAAPEEDPEEELVEYDETGLDEQGFADEDDDFDPSEEIPTDQSIDFPADI